MTAAAGAALFSDVEYMAASLPGYAPRAAQQDMADAVAGAIDAGERVVVEAGTGTGKTLAYLLPALASHNSVIISTATRYLQEQLADKDVPLAQQLLGRSVHTTVLKGRSNYLCLHRLEQAEHSADLYDQSRLRQVRAWAQRTRTGDLGEFADPADGNALWPRITSTTDNCLGRACPLYDQCWVVAARREAQQADVVIINHYLLFADLTLRERGFGELLPAADTVIADEAHKLPDIAGRFFGQALSGRQLRDYVRDGQAELKAAGGDMPDMVKAFERLGHAEQALAEAFAHRAQRASLAWAELADTVNEQAVATLEERLEAVRASLAVVAERSEALAALLQRAEAFQATLAHVTGTDEGSVSWIEPRGQIGWIWHSTPLDVSTPFARAIDAFTGAWVFTSATLAVDNSLAFFCDRMGLADVARHILASPFDYEHNARLYVPASMPRPNAPAYADAVAQQAIALIRAAGGGAFVLCTSHRAVNACADALRDADFEPLVQGQASRTALLAAFRRQQDQILVGTSSFWEGVDVRGHGLRLVIIDKLPFASPSDPVLAARSSAIKAAGGQPFMDYTLPQAVISLKQGVGRLIRDHDDHGLLAICDTRLYGARYAGKIRNSLPSMPVTRDLDAAREFLGTLEPAS